MFGGWDPPYSVDSMRKAHTEEEEEKLKAPATPGL